MPKTRATFLRIGQCDRCSLSAALATEGSAVDDGAAASPPSPSSCAGGVHAGGPSSAFLTSRSATTSSRRRASSFVESLCEYCTPCESSSTRSWNWVSLSQLFGPGVDGRGGGGRLRLIVRAATRKTAVALRVDGSSGALRAGVLLLRLRLERSASRRKATSPPCSDSSTHGGGESGGGPRAAKPRLDAAGFSSVSKLRCSGGPKRSIGVEVSRLRCPREE